MKCSHAHLNIPGLVEALLSRRQTTFSQLFNTKFSRPIRLSIEDGNSFTSVPFKLSSLNRSMMSKISGKASNLEQPLTSNFSRDFNL
ncbi:hypothetical protein ES332_A11G327200v1 [Gossypium tomentosum]|uniref:Uncharacterized protein n=1 Tax=Gossypium tomentosum TaxID=34277 RepID=A0A5D2NJP3_GOSTO|nr:hypothetical protein ES332_A11G327200v1 [Gossypium tomentosum]